MREKPVCRTPYTYELDKEVNNGVSMVEDASYRDKNITISEMLTAGVKLAEYRSNPQQFDFSAETPIGEEKGRAIPVFMDGFQAFQLWKDAHSRIAHEREERRKLEESQKQDENGSIKGEKPSKTEVSKETEKKDV